jgi:uncharacterized membrane protein YfcA
VLLDPAMMRLLIGLIVCAAVAVIARKPMLAVLSSKWLAMPAGFLSGLFGGLASMPGPPAIAYYLSAPTPAPVVRSSLLIFFFATALMAVPGLVLAGLVRADTIMLAVLGVPILLGGDALGAWLFQWAGDARYRQICIVVLAAVGLGTALAGLVRILGSGV